LFRAPIRWKTGRAMAREVTAGQKEGRGGNAAPEEAQLALKP